MIMNIEGYDIDVFRIPSGLVGGFYDKVFAFQTSKMFQTSIYKPTIEKAIGKLMFDMEEQGISWRLKNMAVVKWDVDNQITLVSFNSKEDRGNGNEV